MPRPARTSSAARRRGRRGGRRRRHDGNGEMPPHAEPGADQPDLPPVYTGPTPANPFGGQNFDIFDVLEQAEAAAPAVAVAAPDPAPAPSIILAEPEPAPAEALRDEPAPAPIVIPVEPAAVAAAHVAPEREFMAFEPAARAGGGGQRRRAGTGDQADHHRRRVGGRCGEEAGVVAALGRTPGRQQNLDALGELGGRLDRGRRSTIRDCPDEPPIRRTDGSSGPGLWVLPQPYSGGPPAPCGPVDGGRRHSPH